MFWSSGSTQVHVFWSRLAVWLGPFFLRFSPMKTQWADIYSEWLIYSQVNSSCVIWNHCEWIWFVNISSSQPLGGILWGGLTVEGAVRSAVHLPEGLRKDINVILGISAQETFSTGLRGRGVWMSLMGMASVSWFYLFNIQVRANCTTACNIQVAQQYVN